MELDDTLISMATLATLIESTPLSLANEKQTQADLAALLSRRGIEYQREVTLGDGSIVDFVIDGVAVELKLKGSPAAIYRQIERYAGFASVRGVLLASAKSMGLPSVIEGKPALVASLGAGHI